MGALLEHFAVEGVTIEAVGGDKLRARGPLTDALRATIREHKAAILSELAANEPTVDPDVERRRARALAILDEHPDRRIAVVAEAGDSAHVAVAVRDVAVGELWISAIVMTRSPCLHSCGSMATLGVSTMMAKKKPQAKFPRNAVPVQQGESEGESARNFAELVTSPELAAYRVINAAERKSGLGEHIDVPTLLERLCAVGSEVSMGNFRHVEAMLMNQATALQTLFSRLVERGMGCDNAVPFEINMRIALRAQSQSRAALETLAAIKNPPAVFARQANVTTGPQQINNGISGPSRARENENPPNELLEVNGGECVDAERRASQSAAIRKWRPWERSTGPKTQQGKARASRNAYKGSKREILRELARLSWSGDDRDPFEVFEEMERLIELCALGPDIALNTGVGANRPPK